MAPLWCHTAAERRADCWGECSPLFFPPVRTRRESGLRRQHAGCRADVRRDLGREVAHKPDLLLAGFHAPGDARAAKFPQPR